MYKKHCLVVQPLRLVLGMKYTKIPHCNARKPKYAVIYSENMFILVACVTADEIRLNDEVLNPLFAEN